jgi:hypothetical protein
MKGKLTLWIGIYALIVILYFVNIGAFVVTDVTNDLDLTNFGAGIAQATGGKTKIYGYIKGDTLSWEQASRAQTMFGFASLRLVLFLIALFGVIESRLIASFAKNKKLWKKVTIIFSDFSILYFAYELIIDLITNSGEVDWKKHFENMYIYTFETTRTIYILYVAVIILMICAILKTVNGFKLSYKSGEDNSHNGSN